MVKAWQLPAAWQKAVSERRAEAPTRLGGGQLAAAALRSHPCTRHSGGVAFTSVQMRAESGSVLKQLSPFQFSFES